MNVPFSRKAARSSRALVAMALVLLAAAVRADGGVTFTDLAAGGGAGIRYERVPSASDGIFQQLKERTLRDQDGDGEPDQPLHFEEFPQLPIKSRGAPGVALFDFDSDGDLDIYVTNGPGAANSLFANQLAQSGELRFVDVASEAGVAAVDQDSTGVCYGDLDNDGDPDLLVLGNSQPNRLFENRGTAAGPAFADVTAASGIGGGDAASVTCSMGDVDGDGLLDVAVANTFDMSEQFAIFSELFAFNQHNFLYKNLGGNVFAEVGEDAGIRDLAGFPPENAGAAGITWSLALVDLDLDGDADLVTAEDQAALLPAKYGGTDRGFLHVFENDGGGRFEDRLVETAMDRWGAWMGLAFGDLDRDRRLDVFASNLGDFLWQIVPPPFVFEVGDQTSRWFLGQADGTFADPGVGELIVTPFGWGAAMLDYDNDGDTDIVFHGGLDFISNIDASNPGALLRNDGSARFTRDAGAFAASTDHSRRIVHGVATGDLDGDGFVDVVSVSNMDAPPATPLVLYPEPTGGPFAADAFFVPTFRPQAGGLVWNQFEMTNGSLAVEINGGNSNRRVSVELLGTVGITSRGRVNRDGIGAVVSVTPRAGKAAMQPIVGGSSYASQHSLTAHFGLGRSPRGSVEVLWPGGARNRLDGVRDGERVLFPEIPCSFAGEFADFAAYRDCVRQALDELSDAGVIGAAERRRFLISAIVAFEPRGTIAAPTPRPRQKPRRSNGE